MNRKCFRSKVVTSVLSPRGDADSSEAKEKFPNLSAEDAETLLNVEKSVIGHDACFMSPFGLRRMVYSDFAASGRSIDSIEDFIRHEVLPYYGNTHSEGNMVGSHVTKLRHEAREIIKKCCAANEDDAVIFFGSGMTAVINKLILALNLRGKPESLEDTAVVFIGPYEHHSNELCWRESSAEVVNIDQAENGQIDVHQLDYCLEKYQDRKLKIGSFSAASNITGTLTNVDEINAVLHRHGALSFFDYAAAAPYVKITMNPDGKTTEMSKDAVFISPHKLLGGPGTPGLLIAKRRILDIPVPTFSGGGTVIYVDATSQLYDVDVSEREEAGTPDIVGSIRCGLAFKLKAEIGEELIHRRETDFAKRAISTWSKNPNIFVAGSHELPRLPFISFIVRYGDGFLHHDLVVRLLNDLFGVQGRPGCSCAGPYGQELMGISQEGLSDILDGVLRGVSGVKPGWVRLSLNYFFSEEILDLIVQSVLFVADHGWKFVPFYSFDPIECVWTFRKALVPRVYPQYLEGTSQCSLKDVFFERGRMVVGHLCGRVFHEEMKVLESGKAGTRNCPCRIVPMLEKAREMLRQMPDIFGGINFDEDPEIPPELGKIRWYPIGREVCDVLEHRCRYGLHFASDSHQGQSVFHLRRFESCRDDDASHVKHDSKLDDLIEEKKTRPCYRSCVFPSGASDPHAAQTYIQLNAPPSHRAEHTTGRWVQALAVGGVVGLAVLCRWMGLMQRT